MQDIFDQIYSYAIGIWRYRWVALVVAWLVCVIAWPIVLKMPDEFQASAQVFVDTDFILPEVVGVGLLTDPQTRLQAMSRTLLTRPNLEEVVRITDLDLNINNDLEMRETVNQLRDNIALKTGRGNDLYSISYTDKDPELAKRIVQSVLTLFVENTLRKGGEVTNKVEGFLDQRIAEKEADVIALEEKLTNFKRRNADLLPASGASFRQHISELQGNLEAAKLSLQQSEKRYESLRREIEGETPSFGLGAGLPALPPRAVSGSEAGLSFDTFAATVTTLPEQLRLQNFQQQYDELLLKYTSRHPDVITLKKVISELNATINTRLRGLYREELNRIAADKAQQEALRGTQAADDYRYRLKYQLVEARANIDAQTIQVEDLAKRIKTLREKRDLLPSIEAELRRLESEATSAKKQLAELKQSQRKVELGIQVEQTEDIRFEIIEPPFVPNKPAGPNRLLLFSGALILALGAGLALAFLFTQFRPTYDTRRSLMNAFQAPVLGSVTAFWGPQKLRKKRYGLLAYCCLMACLFTLYIGLMLLEIKGIDIPFV